MPATLIRPLAEVIFGKKFAVVLDVNQFLTETSFAYEKDTKTVKINIAEATSTIQLFLSKTLELKNEEAAGYTPLGAYVIFFCKELTLRSGNAYYHNQQYALTDNGKSGVNPSVDSSIISIMRTVKLPETLYEYKPVIDGDLTRVNKHHVIEGIIQARYCMQYYSRPFIVHCTTDLFNWHYIKYELYTDSEHKIRMKVLWYQLISHSDPVTEEELIIHLNFICKVLLNHFTPHCF